jgi:hypothetical protein
MSILTRKSVQFVPLSPVEIVHARMFRTRPTTNSAEHSIRLEVHEMKRRRKGNGNKNVISVKENIELC